MLKDMIATSPKLDDYRDFFDLIINSKSVRQCRVEKRNNRRLEYPYPVYLTPEDDHGNPILEKTFAVIGRFLSEGGLDFYHKAPVAEKHVIASFEFSPNRWLAVRMELRWCRFARHGYFENGGVFCGLVDSPIAYYPVNG